MHPRRKWSDWGECSVQCKKTRHRLYCDDILGHLNRSSNLASASEQVEQSEIKRPSRLDRIIVKRETWGADKSARKKQRLRRHKHLASDSQLNNNDDDDYADEGDEEGESLDSCDKVDASKTFQEINCRGGQCRLPFVDGSVKDSATLPVRLKQQQQPIRPEQDLLFRHQLQQTFAPLWPPAASGSTTLSQDTSASRFQHHPTHPNQVSARLPTRYPPPNGSSQLNSTPLEPTRQAGNESTGTPKASLPVPVWTRQAAGSLWPQHLFTSNELSPQANLIQWSILIGALLSIVLLIMLILRKLFVPSYHWMLAKQTLKSTSHSCAPPKECRLHGYYSSSSTTVSPTSSTSTTCPTTLIPPTSSSSANPNTRRFPKVHPHMVNSSGQAQLIKSDLLEFNTDHLDTRVKPQLALGLNPRALKPTTSSAAQPCYIDPPQQQQQQPAVQVFQNKSYVLSQWLDSGVNQALAHSGEATNSNKSPSSISSNPSASESHSVQSTTAQLISNVASSSSDNSQDNILDGLHQFNSQSFENSPPSIKSHLINTPLHNKSIHLCSVGNQTQPNSPLQNSTGSHFTPERHFISGHQLTSFLGNRQQSNFRQTSEDCHLDSEYAQPMQEVESGKPTRDSLQRPLGLDQNNSCEISERHFYEEISHLRK